VDLSIIIVNWNTCDLLEKCLHSVYQTVLGLDFEVLVVDNGSGDSSVEMVQRKFPHVRLIQNQENSGFARANNQAIRVSKGKYILLLNSDAYLTQGAAQEMVRLMEKNPEIGIAGASLFYEDGRHQLSYGPLPTLGGEILSLAGLDKVLCHPVKKVFPVQFIETGTVSGACLMARQTMLDQIGLLDESFFMFNEEVDICCRAHKAGWKVVHLPSAKVFHFGGGSTGVSANRYLMLYQGKLKYYAKHYGHAKSRQLLAAINIFTWIKVCIYSFLQRVTLTRAERFRLWQGVASGLGGLQI
jgi:GT2 family glycosyltransferase